MEITTIELGLAKNVLQVHCVMATITDTHVQGADASTLVREI